MASGIKEANDAQRAANQQLDGIRRAQREASTQTAGDVLRNVLERAAQKVWIQRPNTK